MLSGTTSRSRASGGKDRTPHTLVPPLLIRVVSSPHHPFWESSSFVAARRVLRRVSDLPVVSPGNCPCAGQQASLLARFPLLYLLIFLCDSLEIQIWFETYVIT